MIQQFNIFCFVTLFVLLAGTTAGLTQNADRTQEARDAAMQVHADVLAPKMLSTADKTRQKAQDVMGRGRDASKAIQLYTQATMQYGTAREQAIANADFLADTLVDRNAAIKADAQQWAEERWEDGDKEFGKAVRDLERERPESAREYAMIAAQLFRDTELAAIQNRILANARAEIATAEDRKAGRYAPITLDRARQIAAAAETALVEDRYGFDYAEDLARQAEETARHSVQLTEIIRSKPDMEERILLWEGYLARVHAAAGIYPPVDQDPEQAANELVELVEKLVASERQAQRDLADSEAFTAALEEEIRDLDEQLGGASAERRQLVFRLEEQAREREKIRQTEGLFKRNEAEVFKQSDTIIVRLIGLQFASGSADLAESNAGLLRKLEQAIAIWPNSLLIIEGHTDARGSEQLNMKLSQNRADSVMNFLITKMRLPANRITAKGFGESRPIASNKDTAGRAKNRRIDLLILP